MNSADVGVIIFALMAIVWELDAARGHAKNCVTLLKECANSLESLDSQSDDD